MTPRVVFIEAAYLAASLLFILGLRSLTHPDRARRGMQLAALGMLVAIVGTLVNHEIVRYDWILAGLALGTAIGYPLGVFVPMTAMPQRIAISHMFGAIAATLVGVAEFYHLGNGAAVPRATMAALGFEVLFGALTITGSFMAFGKLQELLPSRPLTFKGQNVVSIALFAWNEEKAIACALESLFRQSLFSRLRIEDPAESSTVWPWEKEVLQGDAERILFSMNQESGPGGTPALSIDSPAPCRAAWKVSGLGPAFRQPPFPDGARYRLTALVRGTAPPESGALSIRFHRASSPGLFDTSTYEICTTTIGVAADRWSSAECITPIISPPPDRLHLLCELRGEGSVSFADVRFEILS